MSDPTYLFVERGVLHRRGETIEVHVDRHAQAVLRVADLHELVLIGTVSATPEALAFLLDAGVNTSFLSLHGRFRGRVVADGSTAATLRLAQYAATRDPVRSAAMATCLVATKLDNQRALLLRHARSHGGSAALSNGASGLAAARTRLRLASDLDAIRGCEGAGAAAYFGAFGALLRVDWCGFDGRTRQPPRDPVNIFLSLGYTLLHNLVDGAVRAIGLDPYLGTLHAPLDRRPSLVCDLVEEYRAPVVDAVVVAGLNHQALRPEHIELDGELPRLTRPGFKAFIELFEAKVSRLVHYPPTAHLLGYRAIVHEQARAYARWLRGEGDYVPMELR